MIRFNAGITVVGPTVPTEFLSSPEAPKWGKQETAFSKLRHRIHLHLIVRHLHLHLIVRQANPAWLGDFQLC